MNKLDRLEKTAFDKRMVGRKSRGDLALWYIIYPDDSIRGKWDLLITL
jgi:hypothetical protein